MCVSFCPWVQTHAGGKLRAVVGSPFWNPTNSLHNLYSMWWRWHEHGSRWNRRKVLEAESGIHGASCSQNVSIGLLSHICFQGGAVCQLGISVDLSVRNFHVGRTLAAPPGCYTQHLSLGMLSTCTWLLWLGREKHSPLISPLMFTECAVIDCINVLLIMFI